MVFDPTLQATAVDWSHSPDLDELIFVEGYHRRKVHGTLRQRIHFRLNLMMPNCVSGFATYKIYETTYTIDSAAAEPSPNSDLSPSITIDIWYRTDSICESIRSGQVNRSSPHWLAFRSAMEHQAARWHLSSKLGRVSVDHRKPFVMCVTIEIRNKRTIACFGSS